MLDQSFWLVSLSCLLPLVIIPFLEDRFYLPKFLLLGIFLAWITILCILHPQPLLMAKRQEYRWLLLFALYLCLVILSAVLSVDPTRSFIGKPYRWDGAVTQIYYVFLLMMTVFCYQYRKWHVIALSLSACVVCLYGILQKFGLDFIPRDSIRAFWGKAAYSTLGNPNFLGAYLVLVLPVCLYYSIKKKSLPIAFCSIVMMVCLVFTSSRGAWLGFAVSVALLFVFSPSRAVKKLFGVTALFLTLLTVATAFFDASFHQKVIQSYRDIQVLLGGSPDLDTLGSGRIFIWKKSLALIQMRPLAGFGPECLDVAMDRYFFEDNIRTFQGIYYVFDKAHNELLQIAVSSGVPAMLAFSSGIGVALVKGFRRVRSVPELSPLLCGVCGYLVQSMFSISAVSFAFLFWIFLGITIRFSAKCMGED